MRSPNFDFYLITDRAQTGNRDLTSVLEKALEGGVRAIQLREKDLGGRELFLLAEKSKQLCERYGASLLINDRVDVAMGVDAEGVQLGRTSMPIEAARSILGEQKLIGVSTHSIEEAKAAELGGADFILFGPVFFTPSKARYGEPQGVALLKKVVEKVSLPVYAVGGIKKNNVMEAKKTGIYGAALISAVLNAADPQRAAQAILAAIRKQGDG